MAKKFDANPVQTVTLIATLVISLVSAITAVGERYDLWELTSGQLAVCAVIGAPWLIVALAVGLLVLIVQFIGTVITGM